MSVNLMDMVKQAVSQQAMGKLSGLLGMEPKKTSSVFNSAAGSILGGMMKKGASTQGASDLFDIASKQDTSILGKLDGLLGGGDATDAFQKQGTGLLDSIMGGNKTSMLGTIGKALGIEGGIMSKIMALAAPIVMGVIGKHIKDKALNAVGLGSLLGEQKSHMSKWGMPASLTSGLGFGNLMSGASDAVGNVAGSVGDAAGSLGNAAKGAAGSASRAAQGAAGDAAKAGGGLLKLIIPLLLLGALAFLGIKYLPGILGGAKDAATETAGNLGGMEIPKIEMPSFEGIEMGGFDAQGLGDQMNGITGGFKDLTVDNAGDFAGKIEGFTGSLDSMGIGDLPGPAKTAVGGMFSGFTGAIDKAMGLVKEDGILSVLKPVIDALKSKISGFGF